MLYILYRLSFIKTCRVVTIMYTTPAFFLLASRDCLSWLHKDLKKKKKLSV